MGNPPNLFFRLVATVLHAVVAPHVYAVLFIRCCFSFGLCVFDKEVKEVEEVEEDEEGIREGGGGGEKRRMRGE